MNILLPPKWRITFDDETHYTSTMGSWSECAQLTMIDGLLVYETHYPVKQVEIFFPGRPLLVFAPPTPRLCFAYKRLKMRLDDEEEKGSDWLYTRFGYVDDTDRVTLTVFPGGIVHRSVPRSSPFTP